MGNGTQWVHDRRFFLKNLRNLGMGKSYLEGAIQDEAQALIDDLLLYDGEPVENPKSFRTAALNIIWQMVASECYHHLKTLHNNMIHVLKCSFRII